MVAVAHSNGNGNGSGWLKLLGPFLSGLCGAATVIGFIVTPMQEQMRVVQQQVRDHQIALDDNKTHGSPLAQRNADRIAQIESDVKSILVNGSPMHIKALEGTQVELAEHRAQLARIQAALEAMAVSFKEVETQFRGAKDQMQAADLHLIQRMDLEFGHIWDGMRALQHKLFGDGVETAK